MAVRIGLTGGIGGGKSSVAAQFAKLGVQVIDADEIGRRLCAPGGAQFAEIVEHFGEAMVDANGQLNRQRLADEVFAAPCRRQLLESILHPPIRAEMYARAAADRSPYCILDIPLLIETGQFREMRRVIAVTCPRPIRIARLQATRNMTLEQIEKIMHTQADESERIAIADDLIDNSGATETIAPQAANLHALYLALFAEK